jgi:hypothetical protein
MITLTNTEPTQKSSYKELEFKETTFTEVDKEKMLAKAYSKLGLREDGILSLEGLTYQTEHIRKLFANHAKYDANVLYLKGNVRLEQKEGFSYSTEYANYDQKREILSITSPFVARMNENILRGNTLIYDAVKQEAIAKSVDAEVYTPDK